MKKLFLSILLILLIFTYMYGSLYEENSHKKASFILMNLNKYLKLKGFVYKLVNREFFPKQNLDFISKSTLLYEQLKSIEIYINKIFQNSNSNKIDRYWIGYLKDSGIINGAIIYNKGEIYIIGNINTNIEKKQGFHIINNSLYYYIYNPKKGIKGKFSIENQYLLNNLYFNLNFKVNNLIINSTIVEGPKASGENTGVSKLILYSISGQAKGKENSNSFLSIKTDKEYSKLLNREFVIGLNNVTYIKRMYFNKDTVLIFLTSYRNKITADYIYFLGLLIAVLVDIFLLLLLINNISVKRKGGNLYMGDTEEEKERAEDQLKKQSQEDNLIEEEDTIQEIDNEVSKIILEENLESEAGKKTDKKNIEDKAETQLQIEEEKRKKFEELKKDGIIIK